MTNALGLGLATFSGVSRFQRDRFSYQRLRPQRSSNPCLCNDHCRASYLRSVINECVRLWTVFIPRYFHPSYCDQLHYYWASRSVCSKNAVLPAALDGLWMGLGMTSVLVVLGAMRELIGNGTLFDGADLLLGPWAAALRIEVFQFDSQFLLALLPPGAFIGVGFLIALKNVIDKQIELRQPKQEKQQIERARVTN